MISNFMKKNISLILFVFFLFMNFNFSNALTFEHEISSYIVIDSNTGEILDEQNSNLRIFPASTTKMLTSIVALENKDINTEFKASQKAIDSIGDGGMNIGIMAGENIRLENLLNALMINSANETATIIAENVFGNYNLFIDEMNNKAKQIGLKDSHFVNPSGMHNENHYSTAHDLAFIARYAMKNQKFREIVISTKHDMLPTNKHSSWPTLYTINSILYYNKPINFKKITGVKTGYTAEAKHVLVASGINEKGIELICVTTGTPDKLTRNDCTKKLLEENFKKYKAITILKKENAIKENIVIKNSKNSTTVNAIIDKNIEINSINDNPKYNIEIKFNENLEAPILKGDTIGYMTIKNNSNILATQKLLSSKSVEKASLPKILNPANIKIKESNYTIYIIILISSILIFLIILVYLKYRKKSKSNSF